MNIHISSFSYKQNDIPTISDPSTQSLFIFDCRGITPNPGRFPEIAHLTGHDTEIIDFLHSKTEIQQWLIHVLAILVPHISNMKQRGDFETIHIGFGCTGGRHRSVYMANHCHVELSKLFPGSDCTVVHNNLESSI